MGTRRNRLSALRFFVALLTVLLIPALGLAQTTFRGGINGTVTDQSGAVIPGATVEAVNVETNVVVKTITSTAGEYSILDLALGKYNLIILTKGFKEEKITGITVSAGTVYTQQVKLAVASSTEVVEVSANAFALDTTTATQTTVLDEKAVDSTPLNGGDFTQLTALTPGFANSGAGGYGSLNGTRANQINWQIDGVDNNDIWHNIPAVNQGGVSGIAGIILPIEAVEQFSVQTNATADVGRNPGGTVTLGLKGGTNTLHGSAYYYNRNEFFGAKSPFTSTKQKVRNYNAGFSVGGPIIKDKLFYQLTYEHQRFIIGVPQNATEPNAIWQTYATDLINQNGGTVSSVSTGLLNLLWPSYALSTSAAETAANKPILDNFYSPIPEYGFSHNAVFKVDYHLSDKDSITAHWFGGDGNQVAPVGSALYPYYEVAPIHVYNYQTTWSHVFTPSITNQVVAGVNYFNQVFNDAQTGYNVTTAGLIDGSAYSNAPKIQIQNFDTTGETPPEGRNDITGQISDMVSWTKGKHQLKFGGEFRQIQLNEFYHRKAQGNFVFKGNQGGWVITDGSLASSLDSSTQAAVINLADFLAGDVNTSSITIGNPERTVYLQTYSGFVQDAYQLTPKLNINVGLRWDYEGPFHDSKKDLSVFRPELGGIVFQGAGISNVFEPKYTNFSPRVGLSYQAGPKTVFRAGAGFYYDIPNLNPFLDNRPGNNAPNGVEGNPAGASPVFSLSANGYTWANGVDPFGSATSPTCTSDNPCGVFSVQKSFQPSYNVNLNAQFEESITSNLFAQIGYVGSMGHHLLSIIDLNQSAPNDYGIDQTTRPYYSAFPNYGNINEIQSIGNSNYHSLQATLRGTNYHHFSFDLAYTWSHTFDDVTAYRGALPQDSTNFKGDYGQSDFDTRHIFVGELSYSVPAYAKHKLLTGGFEVSSLLSFHTGIPLTILSVNQTDNTGEGNQRAIQIANPNAGYKNEAVGAYWLNPNAFVDPTPGTWGTTRRNQYEAPGYGDVDLTVRKHTKVHEKYDADLRFDLFNLLNRTNYASPGGYNPNQANYSSLKLSDTIGDYNGAPGIGNGEPFNVQLSLKLSF